MFKNIHLGILLSFLSYSAFAFMDVINKFLFSSAHISFFNYMFWLDLAIIITLIIIAIFTTGLNINFLKTKNYKPVALRSALSVINTLCSLIAISHLPFHIFYGLAFLQPLIASSLSILFLIEKTNFKKIALIIVGFLGIMISIEFWQFNNTGLALIGILGGLGIAISGALSGIVVKKYLPNENTITIALYNILLSILVASFYISFTNETLYLTTDIKTISLIFIGGTLAALGMIFFMMSYQKASVQSISQLQYTQIIWGLFFGYIIFSDIPSLYGIIGVSLIVIANLINIKLAKS